MRVAGKDLSDRSRRYSCVGNSRGPRVSEGRFCLTDGCWNSGADGGAGDSRDINDSKESLKLGAILGTVDQEVYEESTLSASENGFVREFVADTEFELADMDEDEKILVDTTTKF